MRIIGPTVMETKSATGGSGYVICFGGDTVLSMHLCNLERVLSVLNDIIVGLIPS